MGGSGDSGGDAAARALDLAEIAQVVARYGKAIDDKDYALLDTVFTPDAHTIYELDDTRNESGYAEMRRLFERYNARFERTSHLISHPVVALAGDHATAESHLIAVHHLRDPDHTRRTWTVFGTYRDTLHRTPTGWRIHHRHFQGWELGDVPHIGS